jgi:phage recombination protein Bet
MTTQAVVAAPSGGAVAHVTFSDEQKQVMKQTVAKGCTDAEFFLLLQLASTYGLDPFRKEIWAIKRKETEAALIMTSRDGYLKIAQRDPNYLGLQAAVVKKGDHFKFNPAAGTVEHSFGTERGGIIGAWAIAHHKGRMPVVCFVEFSEYRGNSPIWSNYPSAMIQKVAEVFVLKRQFNINGLVTTEEIDAGEAPAPVAAPALSAPATDEWVMSAAQLRRLYGIAKDQAGITTKEDLRVLLDSIEGFPEKEGQLTREQYDQLCDDILPNLKAPKQDVEEADFEDVPKDGDAPI